MIIAKCSDTVRSSILDNGVPSGSIVGYAILLAPGVMSAAISAVNATANVFTSSVNLCTGAKVRIAAGVGGVLPSPLIASVNYFLIELTSTTYSLAFTLVNALAGIAIDITDVGTLPLNFNEQAIDELSPIEQIVIHEIPSSVSGYVRKPVTFEAAVIVDRNVQKPALSINWTTGNTAIDYSAWVVIYGGAAGAGSITGTGVIFGSDGTTYTIAANSSGGVTIRTTQGI